MKIKSVKDLERLSDKNDDFRKYVINRLKGLEKNPPWDEVRTMSDPVVFLITAARVNSSIKEKIREIIPEIIQTEIGNIDGKTDFDPLYLSRAIHIAELFRFTEVFDSLYSFLFHPVGKNIPTATVLDLDILVLRAIASLQDSLDNTKEYLKTWEIFFNQDHMIRYSQVLWTILCAADSDSAWKNIDRLFYLASYANSPIDLEQSLLFLCMKAKVSSVHFKLKLDAELEMINRKYKMDYTKKFDSVISGTMSKIRKMEPKQNEQRQNLTTTNREHRSVFGWAMPNAAG